MAMPNYFGERSLLTGEPRTATVASIPAAESVSLRDRMRQFFGLN